MMRVWILLLFWPGLAGAIIMPSSGETERTIGGDVELLVDAEGDWTIAEVSQRFAGRFTPSRQVMPNFGFTDAVIWFRFTVDFAEVRGQPWYLLQGYPLIDHMVLYESMPEGGFQHTTLGDSLPFAQRPIAQRGFIFPLDTASGDQRTYYLRAAGKGALSFELSLISAQGLIERIDSQQLLFGLFFGAMAAILISNLLLYFSLAARSYLYFVIFLAMLMLSLISMNGFGLQYFWPHWPEINSNYLSFSYFGIAALIGYSMQFLDLRQRMPPLALLCHWLLLSHIVLAMATIFIPPPQSFYLNIVMVLVTLMSLVAIAWLSWRQGYRAARLYLLAWSLFLIALVLFALDSLGIIPHSHWSNYAPYIAAIWVALLLSLALADRVRLVEQARHEQLRHAEQVSRQQVVAAAALDREKRAFLSYLSHELNTPLNWLGNVSLVDRALLPAQLVDALQVVEQGRQRLQRLIDTSLRYFDLVRRERPPSLGQCQPALLIEQVRNEQAELLADKQIRLVNRVAPQLQVLGCQPELSEVLAIVLDNAIRVSPAGGEIECSARCENGWVTLLLSDQGGGFAVEQAELIFRPFFRVGSNHRMDGFGLSLPMARLMMEQMGGSIQALGCGAGSGAVFSLRLPLAE